MKSFTARKIAEALEVNKRVSELRALQWYMPRHKQEQQHIQIWQEGSHPKVVDSDEMLAQKIDYVHNNPVVAGLVDDAAHWRYSSARNYSGQAGLLDVDIIM